jgi:hypothetical protein
MQTTTGAPDWQSYTFTDRPTRHTYYRIELHAAPADDHYSAIRRRDHETVQALSNPVWVAL